MLRPRAAMVGAMRCDGRGHALAFQTGLENAGISQWAHGVRGGASTRKITKRALFRELPDTKLQRSSPDTYRGRHMPKQHVIFDEGSVEAVERLRKQDEEFCRRLRVAVEMGNEFCPTTVITAPCTSRPVLNYMRTD